MACATGVARRSARSFASYYRRVDDALRHCAYGFRLLDSPLVGRPVFEQLTLRLFRCCGFSGVHPRRTVLQQATEGSSAILTPRQALAI